MEAGRILKRTERQAAEDEKEKAELRKLIPYYESIGHRFTKEFCQIRLFFLEKGFYPEGKDFDGTEINPKGKQYKLEL